LDWYIIKEKYDIQFCNGTMFIIFPKSFEGPSQCPTAVVVFTLLKG